MRTYTLTIKGEPAMADAALAEHGFGGDHVADLGFEQVIRIAVADDDIGYRANNAVGRLNAWFCESIGHAPFPIGTLLYWAPDVEGGDNEPKLSYRRECERAA